MSGDIKNWLEAHSITTPPSPHKVMRQIAMEPRLIAINGKVVAPQQPAEGSPEWFAQMRDAGDVDVAPNFYPA